MVERLIRTGSEGVHNSDEIGLFGSTEGGNYILGRQIYTG